MWGGVLGVTLEAAVLGGVSLAPGLPPAQVTQLTDPALLQPKQEGKPPPGWLGVQVLPVGWVRAPVTPWGSRGHHVPW